MKYFPTIVIGLLAILIAAYFITRWNQSTPTTKPASTQTTQPEAPANPLCATFPKHSPPYKALRCKE